MPYGGNCERDGGVANGPTAAVIAGGGIAPTGREWGNPTERREGMSQDTTDYEALTDETDGTDVPATLGFDRRTLMKLFGAGAAVSVGSGVAGAAPGETGGDARIDPYYGYSSPGDRASDARMKEKQDHTVSLYIEFEEGQRIPFFFEPMGLHVDEGDVVRFEVLSPDHTVTAYHERHGRQQRVPDDAMPFSSPIITPGGFWLYRFDEPGLYDIYCAPHEFFGMVARIVVGDPDDDEYDGEFGAEGRPPVSREALGGLPGFDPDAWPFATPAEVFATDALAEERIVDCDSVSRADVVDDL